jgi:hypothetical protein
MWRKMVCIAGMGLCSAGAAHAGLYLAPTIVYESISVPDVGFNGVGPRLTLGYQDYIYNQITGAAEIFASPSVFSVYNNPNNNGSLRITYAYGASFLPGYNFDNSIIGYLRIGIIRSRFDNIGVIRSGGQYGMGIQWVLTTDWSARVEYAYAKYNNITPLGHPDESQYSLGLMYRFA